MNPTVTTTLIADKIPLELRQRPQWVCWRLEAGYSEPRSDELVALWNALCVEK